MNWNFDKISVGSPRRRGRFRRPVQRACTMVAVIAVTSVACAADAPAAAHATTQSDPWSLLFVFALSTFIGLGVILRVSRLLHTPLMSLTNAISAIAVVGSIIVTGSDYPGFIRFLGAVALFASMTNIVSGFLLTDRMLKMFKQPPGGRV
jgi:NAD(P) transhydrogenase subunit alpha